MLRTHGARLAVPLTLCSILVAGLHLMLAAPTANAVDGCRPTPRGIECSYSGSTKQSGSSSKPSSGSSTRRPVATPLPPLRYFATSGGRCWYWSRYPPGFDSWNPRYDQSIILTKIRIPKCRGRSAPPPPVVTVDVAARAWSIFRSFSLDAPQFRLTPPTGITNLPSRLHLDPPHDFTHSERLPDGRRLDVHARVETVWISWNDGSPTQASTLGAAVGNPGSIRHTYVLKTCPPEYRATHLDGPKCHPVLAAYRITVTFEWVAQYRTGARWTRLGSIDRSTSISYDVDEVLGVLAMAP